MRPYYCEDGITIYHGRAEDVLPGLTPIELVVTSPPYNKGKQSGDYANMRHGYAEHTDDMPEPEYEAWQRAILAACWDRLTSDGAIFYNHKVIIRGGTALLPTRLVPEGVTLRQVIVWDRGGGMNWSPRFFCPQHEWVMLLAKPEFAFHSRGASQPGDVWRLPIEQTEYGHPCPFPLALPLTAISATTAQTVLDPFMGSGTTLRAAKDLGRRAIGIDVSERYCEIAAKRLAQGVLDFSSSPVGVDASPRGTGSVACADPDGSVAPVDAVPPVSRATDPQPESEGP